MAKAILEPVLVSKPPSKPKLERQESYLAKLKVSHNIWKTLTPLKF
jgi:hypothetical protein